MAAFQNHQKRKENKDCSRDTIRRQRLSFHFGLFSLEGLQASVWVTAQNYSSRGEKSSEFAPRRR